MWISSTPSSVAVSASKRRQQRVGHLPPVGVGGLLGEPREGVPQLPAAEAVVGDALAPDDVEDRLLALLAQQLLQLPRRPQDVGVVAARQAAIAGHHQDGRALPGLLLLQQRVLDVALAGHRADDVGDRTGVGLRGRDAGLRLHDAAGRDELHRLGDLLRGLHRLGPPAQLPQLGAHLRWPGRRRPTRRPSPSSARRGGGP